MANKSSWTLDKYKSIWCSDEERYKEIERTYRFFSDENGNLFHKGSFMYHTKMLFENRKVFCSQSAWDLISKRGSEFTKEELEALRKGDEQETYLQPKVHRFRKDKKETRSSLVWEHVVPFTVLVSEFIKDQSQQNYYTLLNMGVVCIITRDEDRELTRKGLADSMPNGWIVGDDIWARYKAVQIEIVK